MTGKIEKIVDLLIDELTVDPQDDCRNEDTRNEEIKEIIGKLIDLAASNHAYH